MVEARVVLQAKQRSAAVVTTLLGALAGALAAAAIWRMVQFGIWTEAGWAGVAALAVGQLGAFALPGAYFYLAFDTPGDPYTVGGAGPLAFGLIALNAVIGLATAFAQFSPLHEFAPFALNAGIPLAAAAMLCGALDQLGKLTH